MSEADARLKALFGEDQPAPRDPVFVASVMETLARRRFRDEVIWLAGVAVLSGLVLWALWPVLSQILPLFTRSLMPVVACLVLAAIALSAFEGRIGELFGAES